MASAMYEDVMLNDGRLTRQCIVNEECRNKNISYLRRVDMMNHLHEVHGIVHDIPCRKVGRPSGLLQACASRPPNYEKQSRARFEDVEYKFKRNTKKYLHGVKKALGKAWETMNDDERLQNGQFENFLEVKTKEKMDEYLNSRADRIQKIQNKVDKGYDAYKRVQKVGENAPHGSQATNKIQNDGGQECSTPKNLSSRDEHGPSFAPTKLKKGRDYSRDTIFEESLRSLQNEVVMPTPKTKKIRLSLRSKKQISITDSPCLAAPTIHSLIISNDGIEFDPSTSTTNHKAVIRESFESGHSIHFISQRSSLIGEVDIKLLEDMKNEEASTKTMNLFMLWLENTMAKDTLDHVWFLDSLWHDFFMAHVNEDTAIIKYFGDIDVAKHLFVFLPIVDKHHWILFVLYNNHVKKLVRLPWEDHGVLYFNSLARSDPRPYLSIVYRALKILSKSCSNLSLKSFMEKPRMALNVLEIPEVPRQPNATDCGFYTMMYIKKLIEGAYGKRSKSWLTKTWFKHVDVVELKEGLLKWSEDALDIEMK